MAKIKLRRINGRYYYYKIWWEKIDGKWKKRHDYLGPAGSPRAGIGKGSVSFLIQGLLGQIPPMPPIPQAVQPRLPREAWAKGWHYTTEEWNRYQDRVQWQYSVTPNMELALHLARQDFPQIAERARQEEEEAVDISYLLMTMTPEEIAAMPNPDEDEAETLSIPEQPVVPDQELEAAPQPAQLALGDGAPAPDDVYDPEPDADQSPDAVDAPEGSGGQDVAGKLDGL